MAKVTVADSNPKGGGRSSSWRPPPTLHTYVVDGEPELVGATEPIWIAVKLVEQVGAVALVEWSETDDWRRAYVPANELTPRGVTAEALRAGAPYGMRWESVIELPTLRQLGRALRQQGIWTADDLARRMGEASQALVRVSLESLRRAVRAAKE